MIINANALHIPLTSGIVQTCVTSPPYFGLRDYGVTGQIGLEQTPQEYVDNLVAVFREVWRVMRDDGTLWLNLGDSYNAGRDGGHPGGKKQASLDRHKGISRSGANVPDLKPKDLIGIPWRVAFALQADGWYLRSDIIWSKPNPMPESVTDRCTKSHEYIFLFSKSARYYYDAEAIKEPQAESTGPRMLRGVSAQHKNVDGAPGQPPHSMSQPRENARKARDSFRRDNSSRPDGLVPGNKENAHRPNRPENDYDTATRNKRTVWTVPTSPYAGAHFATFPPKLIEPCILAGSRPGDLVLDPFSGSGTTGRVAAMHSRRYVGVELNPAYIALSPERMTVQTVML